MKKNIIIGLSIVALTLVSCNQTNGQSDSEPSNNISKENESSTKDSSSSSSSVPSESSSSSSTSAYQYSGTYYSSITSLNSTTLKNELNTLLNKGFKSQTYTSDSTYLQTIDSYDTNYVECLYTGLRLDKDQIGTQWNKEHIWAKSLGFNDQSYSAYSDLHHLRVTQMAANSNRSNKYFAEGGTTTSYGYKYTSTTFEPRDEVKGDVARMILYMTVMYDSDTLDLELTNDTSLITTTKGGTAYIGLLDTLLKWNMEDPVDSREIARNDAIYNIQNNRNPFIDHPSYAYYIYKEDYERLGYTEEDAKTLETTRTLKDDNKIKNVNELINAIPNSVTDTNVVLYEEALEDAKTMYEALDSESKSFVTGYKTLVLAEEKLDNYQSAKNQDTTKSTSFALTSLSSTKGSITENGISVSYKAAMAQAKGLYAQSGNPITLTCSNLYDAIKTANIVIACNKNNPTSTITISDGTNKVSQSVSTLTSNQTINISLDTLVINKDTNLTVTITNDGTGSVIVSSITFNI